MKKIKKVLILVFTLVLSISMIPTINVSAAKKVKLNKTKATIYVGKTVTLKLKNNKKKVKWSSSNKKVATVSSKGKVKAKRVGKVTITAKVGKKRWDCKITVKKKKVSTKNNNNTNNNSNNNGYSNKDENNKEEGATNKQPTLEDLVNYINTNGLTDRNGYKYIYDTASGSILRLTQVKVISNNILEFYNDNDSAYGGTLVIMRVDFSTGNVSLDVTEDSTSFTYNGTVTGKIYDVGLKKFVFSIKGTNDSKVKERLQQYFNGDVQMAMGDFDIMLKVTYMIKGANLPSMSQLGFVNY